MSLIVTSVLKFQPELAAWNLFETLILAFYWYGLIPVGVRPNPLICSYALCPLDVAGPSGTEVVASNLWLWLLAGGIAFPGSVSMAIIAEPWSFFLRVAFPSFATFRVAKEISISPLDVIVPLHLTSAILSARK